MKPGERFTCDGCGTAFTPTDRQLSAHKRMEELQKKAADRWPDAPPVLCPECDGTENSTEETPNG